ncbi:hypothetical protein DMUE_4572 [Dictyocoela muelleri]|nr:hypothetical protein DMUE_4572 [Dictyocoela muelleri]
MDLGKDALNIFYNITKGKYRASNENWTDIYNEYKSRTDTTRNFQSFKVYMYHTRKKHNQLECLPNSKLMQKHNNDENNDEINDENKDLKENKNDKSSNESVKTNWSSNENNDLINNNDEINNENETGHKHKNFNRINDDQNIFINNYNTTIQPILATKNENLDPGDPFTCTISPNEIQKIKEIFNHELQKRSVNEELIINNRTHKIPHILVDWKVINQLNIIIKEKLFQSKTTNINQLIKLIFTAQLTYDTYKKRDKKQEKYEDKLKKKLEILKASLDSLEVYKSKIGKKIKIKIPMISMNRS